MVECTIHLVLVRSYDHTNHIPIRMQDNKSSLVTLYPCSEFNLLVLGFNNIGEGLQDLEMIYFTRPCSLVVSSMLFYSRGSRVLGLMEGVKKDLGMDYGSVVWLCMSPF